MIKTAAIFPAFCAGNSDPVMSAVSAALLDWGIKINHDCMQSDVAIIWSVLWSGRLAGNRQVYERYKKTGRPVIVIDVGTLLRGVTWKIALNNINGQGWWGDPIDVDADRPRQLGLQARSSSGGSSVLIALQHSKSLQVESIPDMRIWLETKIAQMRTVTDRPIKIRPHPRDPLRWPLPNRDAILEQPKKIPGSYDDFDWSNDYHAVINHNSGPGVLAAVAGVRPIVHDTSLAWPVSVNISDIEKPYDIDRDSWLIDIANKEYTVDEIRGGLWLKRLRSGL